jgi:5-methylcytosine-specific restriction protein A
MSGYTTEILFGAALGAWILYEVYGRQTLEWLAQWSLYIRIAGGTAVLGYLYWQARSAPEAFQDSLGLAKQVLTTVGGSASIGGGGSTREKRNVTALQKKKIAASQEWKCGQCKSLLDETYEVDHRVALFNGGTNDESNLVALCPHCHRKKTVDERIAAATA